MTYLKLHTMDSKYSDLFRNSGKRLKNSDYIMLIKLKKKQKDTQESKKIKDLSEIRKPIKIIKIEFLKKNCLNMEGTA